MTAEQQVTGSWSNASGRLQTFTDAANMARLYRAVYEQCRIILAQHARYAAGSDPVFKAAIDTLFTQAEWSELVAMKAQVQALITDWDTNHPDAVGKPKAAQLPALPSEEASGLP